MILITGATGFVGKNLVLELAKRDILRILVRKTSNIELFKENRAIEIAEKLPLALFLVALLVFIHQLTLTHHICGPLVNFLNTFNKISQGNLARKVQLRFFDDLTQVLVWRDKAIMHHAINNSRRKLFTAEKNPDTPPQFFQFLAVITYH